MINKKISPFSVWMKGEKQFDRKRVNTKNNKRKDKNRIVLRTGEGQRPNGPMNIDGQMKNIRDAEFMQKR